MTYQKYDSKRSGKHDPVVPRPFHGSDSNFRFLLGFVQKGDQGVNGHVIYRFFDKVLQLGASNVII